MQFATKLLLYIKMIENIYIREQVTSLVIAMSLVVGQWNCHTYHTSQNYTEINSFVTLCPITLC